MVPFLVPIPAYPDGRLSDLLSEDCLVEFQASLDERLAGLAKAEPPSACPVHSDLGPAQPLVACQATPDGRHSDSAMADQLAASRACLVERLQDLAKERPAAASPACFDEMRSVRDRRAAFLTDPAARLLQQALAVPWAELAVPADRLDMVEDNRTCQYRAVLVGLEAELLEPDLDRALLADRLAPADSLAARKLVCLGYQPLEDSSPWASAELSLASELPVGPGRDREEQIREAE